MYFKKLKPEDDGRRKILPAMYPAIREYYKEVKSMRATAKRFGVSKRLIQFIIYPERLKALQERNRQEQHWKKYFNRKQLTEATARLRAKKIATGYKITKEEADKLGIHSNS